MWGVVTHQKGLGGKELDKEGITENATFKMRHQDE